MCQIQKPVRGAYAGILVAKSYSKLLPGGQGSASPLEDNPEGKQITILSTTSPLPHHTAKDSQGVDGKVGHHRFLKHLFSKGTRE